MKNALKTVFLIVSSLIGAGFASGREIMEFFPAGYGLATGIISVALISVYIYIILGSSGEITENKIYRFAVSLFSLCVMAVMIAASGEILPEGKVLMSSAVFITLIFGIKGVENASSILCPAMILFIILFGLERISGIRLYETGFGSLKQSFLYAGYNVITFPVLLKNNKSSKMAVSVMVFTIMAILIYVVYKASSLLPDAKMPFVSAVGNGYLTSAIMLMALYTTAVCSGFCILNIFKNPATSYISVILALLFSYYGFSQLISNGYRTFGFAGTIVILYELYCKIKKAHRM